MIKDFSDLNTRITFYEFAANDGPEPGESEKRTLYSCWAEVDKVWTRDLEQAKANDTLEDITLFIRDPHRSFVPTNKHYISIEDFRYRDKRFNVKEVRPDLQDQRYMRIVAGLVS